MAKDKTKNPPVEAPVIEKKEDKVPATKEQPKVNVPGMPDGMSQHDKVLYASVIQHRKDEMVRTGGESADKYNALTIIEDATIIDIAVTELVIKKNPSALILSANEKNYGAIQLLAADMGVTLPDFKSLPKPTKEQLKAVGLEAAPGQVVLKLEDKNVSKKAKEQKKKEQKVIDDAKNKDYVTDHTKIETDDQLKEALEFQLLNTKVISPLDRLITTAQFYRAYLEARAEKSDNSEAELAKIHEFSLADLLQDITTMVEPTFILTGFGSMLCKRVAATKSVIPAFELLKRCGKNRKTGTFRFSDEEIAALVRVLVVWKASAKIASIGKDIAILSKDAKKNASALDKANAEIAAEQALMSYVTEPSFEVVDNLIAAYNNKDNEMHESAKAIVSSIIETHYKDVEIPELEFDGALLNIQQRAGVVLNLFNSPVGRRDDYSEENLTAADWEGVQEKKEEAPAEGEAKNS